MFTQCRRVERVVTSRNISLLYDARCNGDHPVCHVYFFHTDIDVPVLLYTCSFSCRFFPFFFFFLNNIMAGGHDRSDSRCFCLHFSFPRIYAYTHICLLSLRTAELAGKLLTFLAVAFFTVHNHSFDHRTKDSRFSARLSAAREIPLLRNMVNIASQFVSLTDRERATKQENRRVDSERLRLAFLYLTFFANLFTNSQWTFGHQPQTRPTRQVYIYECTYTSSTNKKRKEPFAKSRAF